MSQLNDPRKFLTQKSGMTHATWRRVQQLRPTHQYLHVSKTFSWTKNPLTLRDGIVRLDIVRFDRGVTYKIVHTPIT